MLTIGSFTSGEADLTEESKISLLVDRWDWEDGGIWVRGTERHQVNR
jgi:hypothetical protein